MLLFLVLNQPGDRAQAQVCATFCGESTDVLLEALIAASEPKRCRQSVSAAQLRELVPFDFTGGDQAMCVPADWVHAGFGAG
jgi:hypothetical protein